MNDNQIRGRWWLVTKIAKTLFPSCCVFCHKILPDSDEPDICDECQAGNARIKPAVLRKKGEFFDGFMSVYAYRGGARKAMLNFKFKRKAYIAPVFARKMTEQIAMSDFPEFDIITWVPVHRKTLRKRGYDQAELLARAIAKNLGVSVVRMLNKNRVTAPMHTLKAAERRANVLGAYETLREVGDLKGLKILLVDDTLTTGATIAECARMLKTGGAEKVWCITFAKA